MARGLTHDDFLRWLRGAVKTAGGQRELAGELGISAGYLSDILNRHRLPSRKLLAAVGYRCERRYYPVSELSA